MTFKPAKRNLEIPERGTFRERYRILMDCTGSEVYASAWIEKWAPGGPAATPNRVRILDFDVTWVDRAEDGWDPDNPTRLRGTFVLEASWELTRNLPRRGNWELLWVPPNGDRNILVEGEVFVNPNLTEAP